MIRSTRKIVDNYTAAHTITAPPEPYRETPYRKEKELIAHYCVATRHHCYYYHFICKLPSSVTAGEPGQFSWPLFGNIVTMSAVSIKSCATFRTDEYGATKTMTGVSTRVNELFSTSQCCLACCGCVYNFERMCDRSK